MKPLIERICGYCAGKYVGRARHCEECRHGSVTCSCGCGAVIPYNKRKGVQEKWLRGHVSRTCQPRIRHCTYCDKDFSAKYWNCSVCYECREPKLCLCGCGLYASGGPHKVGFLPNHHLGVVPMNFKDKLCSMCELPFTPRNGGHWICDECKKPRPCLCGCGGMTSGWDVGVWKPTYYIQGHFLPNMGKYFKRVDGFRSSWEKEVATYLNSQDIAYEYEEPTWFADGKIFYPDFKIGSIFVEVTGYAFACYTEYAVKKFRKMLGENYKLVIVTGKKLLEKVTLHLPDVPVVTMEDIQKIKNFI